MVLASARQHRITDEKVRSVIEYPMWTARVLARIPDSQPRLYIGQRTDSEPPVEVLADTAGGQCVVFHAMLLRLFTLAQLGEHTAAILLPELTRRQSK